MQARIRTIAVFFFIGFLMLIIRLFYWQVIKGPTLSEAARYQYESSKIVSAPRGNILDSNGNPLAYRGEAWLVYGSLREIKADKGEISKQLAQLFISEESFENGEEKEDRLEAEKSRIENLLNKDNVVWVPLKNSVSTQIKKNIESLEIAGIGFERKEDRIYPEASGAAHLLGFVGKDEHGEDKGYFGLEGFYDLVLSGKPGFMTRESDALGIPIVLGDVQEVSAIEGVDLITNIKKGVQVTVEKELKSGVEKYGASSGTVIVMDPKDGAIYAMASYPSFEPANYPAYSDELFRNPAISELFEPGSIFKVVVMAAGLDSGAVTPNTTCDICSGPLKVDKYFIETWNNEYHPNSTMTEVIVHSDNVGMAFIGQRIGANKLYDYLNKFGVGHLTGIDLQGEATASQREKGTWNVVDLATTTFGQGIAVTPIQMIRAVAAIANDGNLVTPRVVSKLKKGSWQAEVEKTEEVRVISEKAANEITAMMLEAASNGEAKWTHKAGFRVAGKTGTAQIPIAGHYDAKRTIASFVGFAPAEDPKFVMLVILREPTSSQWASETAAPLWYSIAEDLFLEFGIHPEK